MIDLRSDTVTKPTSGMLEAMFNAQVGDDVFEEDPTVNELEKYAADLFGMEDALFAPSGTMTNQIAIKVHTVSGDEVICSYESHIYRYEGGGIALNSGASVRLIPGESGLLTAGQIAREINDANNVHLPVSKLVSLENTSNRGGGLCYDFKEIEAIKEVCDANGLRLHLDGARIFNAIIKNNENPKDYGRVFDSVSVCLSKGLGAPVGSLLIGDKAFIKQARRVRKVFGGGMRQVGYIAAAGLYALKNNVSRLEEDHQRAARIAASAEKCSLVSRVIAPETNIVVFYLKDGLDNTTVLEKLKSKGVLGVDFGLGRIRLTTHLNLSDSDVEYVCSVLEEIV